MTLTVITATGDRPEAFSLCELWMSRQLRQPDQWIVLDDGEKPCACTRNQTQIYCPEFRGKDSLNRKIHYAIFSKLVFSDAVVFVEDDDWYSPLWLQTCERQLSGCDLFGEGNALYYNVKHRYWFQHSNFDHASLCSTAIRASHLYQIENNCGAGHPFIDELAWKSFHGRKSVSRPVKRQVIGIKGMPGRAGYGAGHGPADPGMNSDPQLNKLKTLIGNDYEYYRKFGEP